MPPNPFLLAADNPAALLALLRDTPSLASQQDDHGYSLLHAAASYNHLGLLRALVNEFRVPVNLRDEDSETALFVVETVEAARLLVEELGIDTALAGDEGLTAREKIQQDGDFPAVAEYLAGTEGTAHVNGASLNGSLPPVPQGLSVNFGTVNEDEAAGASPDPEFRRRIEELAAREDLDTEAGQAALRQLVEEAVAGEELAQERNVRPRQG
ncbi:ankyrin repeat protein [Diaporthe eres]|uniref:Ankyrin repeat protein n=1 Tax=Diaporthe vaccinii TaxID=105482 RepID=A0ABR4EFT1_9PEZI|nr:ankyrin repeat protein [Diaporthe eres]